MNLTDIQVCRLREAIAMFDSSDHILPHWVRFGPDGDAELQVAIEVECAERQLIDEDGDWTEKAYDLIKESHR